MTAATASAPAAVPLASRHSSEGTSGDPAPSQRAVCYAALAIVDAIVSGHPRAGHAVWQALVQPTAKTERGFGRSLRPHAIAAARTILRALPADAQTAHAGYRAASTLLTGALADTVSAQNRYPCLPIASGGHTIAIELHPASHVGGAAGPWLTGRVLAHLFRATLGNPSGRTLGRHDGVVVLCWRNLEASEHRCEVGKHPLGLCSACAPFAAAVGLATSIPAGQGEAPAPSALAAPALAVTR